MGQHKLTEQLCLCCGRPFMAREADVKKGWGDFCSRSCKNTGQFSPYYKGGQLSNYEYKLRAMKKNPERFLAMQMVQTAIRNGTLVRGRCEICHSDKVEAHHDDYSKPLEVRWVCRFHHNAIRHG